MIPTGFKLYFGIAAAALVAAAIGGYTSGGGGVGPISAGYKGGIGDHVSYAVLLGVAVVAIAVGSLLGLFRDADPEAVASSMGLGEAPEAQRPAAASIWPIIAAGGLGAVAVGLAVSPLLFAVGLVVLVMVAFEWTMTAWADRVSADSEANEELRSQIMGPFEIPLLGLLGGGVFVLAMSRILLAAGATGAVIAGALVSILILGTGVLLTQSKVSKNVLTALVSVVVVGVLAGGIWGAIAGPAEHGEHGEHEGESHDEGAEDSHEEDA